MGQGEFHAFSIGFPDQIQKLIDNWIDDHDCLVPRSESVGKIAYSFTQSSFGLLVSLACKCGKQINDPKLIIDDPPPVVTFGFGEEIGKKIDNWLAVHDCPKRGELRKAAENQGAKKLSELGRGLLGGPAPTFTFTCQKDGGDNVEVDCGFGHKFGPIDCHGRWRLG